ncbi:hypothetical protein C882_2546 [Caenispirillum salinarum AK4]|uniref:Polymerase nucleotidyl transferase domain-containing protein n=1 Tax=Caenispirillum salinarum AK4 TaxID=1238182 RepID=K9H4G8_9PROT|nr:nucleotidyltransferase domain-containing protein [Caenispirillum salinarum]EKV32467.1 hypothetical protein C882_2546 [Caenispirillum salinarum AK4]
MNRTPTVQDIRQRLAAHADEMWSLGVQQAAVFGSVARGEARPGSDVDLLVTLRPDKRETLDIIQASGLQLDLSRIVGADVQVVPAGRLSQPFLDTITPDLVDVFH